jgi:tape measure domain-containing protein
MADDVGITIKVAGGTAAAAQAKAVASAIGGIGHAAGGAAAAGVAKLGSSMDRLGSSLLPIGGMLRGIRNHAWYAGAGLAGLGGLAVKSGLQFNSTMEQNTVAFSHFLGSTRQAHDYLGRLYGLAAHTPFEFPQLTSAATKMLAFGFSADEAYKTLNAVGDAAAGLGTGAEGIDRITIALGQMRAKGVVQGDELLQLQEAGINPYRYLERAGLIKRSDIGQIGQMHLDSRKAIAAIVGGIESDPTKGGFGGLAAAQGRTFAGQISTLRDYTNQTLGTITRPLFDDLEKQGLPKLTDFAQRMTQIWGGDATTGMKVFQSERAFHNRFDPMIAAAKKAVGDMHIGTWLGHQVEKETPKVLGALGHLGWKGLGAFAKGWWDAGPYGKLFGALLVASKLGVFRRLGGLAFDQFVGSRGGQGKGGSGWLGRQLPTPRGPAGAGRLGTTFGTVFGVAAEAAIAVAIGNQLVDLSDQLGLFGGAKGRRGRANWVDEHIPGMKPLRELGQRLGLDPKPVGAGPARRHDAAARAAAPFIPGVAPIVVHAHTHLDGKEVAKSTLRHAKDANANRRGGGG